MKPKKKPEKTELTGRGRSSTLGPAPAASSLSGAGDVARLEHAIAQRLGVRFVLALSSGTAAIYVALHAAGVRRGDEVIVPAYDWGAAAAAVRALGGTVRFADIEPGLHTVDPASVAARISPRARAVVATHLLGQPADVASLTELASAHGLALVEDCAQAFGAVSGGRPVGTFGTAGCFSLGPGKELDAGEGGFLVTDDPAIFERAVLLSQHPLRHRREGLPADPSSFNFRMHPLAPRLAIERLATIDALIRERRAIAQRINAALENCPWLDPVAERPGTEHSFHTFSPTFRARGALQTREALVDALRACGLRAGLGPVHSVLSTHTGPDRCRHAEKRCDLEEIVLALPTELEVGRWRESLVRIA